MIAGFGMLGQPIPAAPALLLAAAIRAASAGCTSLVSELQKKPTNEGFVLRKFALLFSACAVLVFVSLFANFASAQQGDILVGGSILVSPAIPSDVVSFHPPIEKGGTYLSLGADYVGFPHRLGLNVETAWRYHQASYFGTENYRPIFTDVNVLFQPKLPRKFGLDVIAGIGIASNRFDILTSCSTPGCVNFTSSNHFMEDFGAGLRYYVWHRLPHVFVRPEGHYYHIQNNQEFNSNNVFRVGVSVGYTIGK
jgi:hypothetical protein